MGPATGVPLVVMSVVAANMISLSANLAVTLLVTAMVTMYNNHFNDEETEECHEPEIFQFISWQEPQSSSERPLKSPPCEKEPIFAVRWLLGIVVVLLARSIPWYWQAG